MTASGNPSTPWVYGGDRHWQREGVGYIAPTGRQTYEAMTWAMPGDGGKRRYFWLLSEAKAWLDKTSRSTKQERDEFDAVANRALDAMFKRIGVA